MSAIDQPGSIMETVRQLRRKLLGKRCEVSESLAKIEPLERRQLLSVTSAYISPPATAYEGMSVAFQVGATTDHDGIDGGHAVVHWSVNWGDGHTDSFNTVGNPNVYHTYMEESGSAGGSYSISAVAYDDPETTYGITSSTYLTSTSLSVSDAALHATGETTTIDESQPQSQAGGEVASFTDDNPYATTSDFTALIDWGDGNTSSGQIIQKQDGSFGVIGYHSYDPTQVPNGDPVNGIWDSTITILDNGGSSDAAYGQVMWHKGPWINLTDTGGPSGQPMNNASISISLSGGSPHMINGTEYTSWNWSTPISGSLSTVSITRQIGSGMIGVAYMTTTGATDPINVTWSGVVAGDRFTLKVTNTSDGSVGIVQLNFVP